jgi:hypothetical protein
VAVSVRATDDKYSSWGSYVVAALIAVFMVRVLGSGWGGHFHAVWPDATWPRESYLAVARLGPFRPSFFVAYRPIGYPLLLWALGRSSMLTAIAQTALYCGAVVALCTTAWRVLHSRAIAVATVCLLVAIAVQARYAMWTVQILSESLAMSLGLLALAAWWRFAAAPTRPRVFWAFAFTIGWMLTRDAHVLTATVVVVPTAALVAWRAQRVDSRIRRTLLSGALLIVVTACYSYVAEHHSQRARLSFHDVIGLRVLPDPSLSKWFVAHGMPLDGALRSRTGKSGLDDGFYKTTDPGFTNYMQWASGAGPRALALSLVALAPRYRDKLYKDLPGILKGDVQYYDTQGVYNRLPRQMPVQLGGPTSRGALVGWFVVAVVGLCGAAALAHGHREQIGVIVFASIALLFTVVEIYTTWVGDPVELERHLIGALQRLSVTLVVAVAVTTDTLFKAIFAASERRRTELSESPVDA